MPQLDQEVGRFEPFRVLEFARALPARMLISFAAVLLLAQSFAPFVAHLGGHPKAAIRYHLKSGHSE